MLVNEKCGQPVGGHPTELKNWQVPEPGRHGAQGELAVLSNLHSVVKFFHPTKLRNLHAIRLPVTFPRQLWPRLAVFVGLTNQAFAGEPPISDALIEERFDVRYIDK